MNEKIVPKPKLSNEIGALIISKYDNGTPITAISRGFS